MQRQLVFQEKKEMERLCVQNSLLSCCEAPVFAQIFSEHSDMGVLDIGCNDGTKTVERFSSEKVAKVIGLEYTQSLRQERSRHMEMKNFYSIRLMSKHPIFPIWKICMQNA